MHKIVAVGGQYQNGKDTVANMLVEYLGAVEQTQPYTGQWLRTAYADHVKDICCKMFGVTRAFIEHWKVQPTPPPGWKRTMRDTLIWLGDGARDSLPSVWMDRVYTYSINHNLAISDARYFNELQSVKDRHGITVLVWFPGRENNKPNKSEQELFVLIQEFIKQKVRGRVQHPLVDWFVVNDGSLEDLRTHVKGALAAYVIDHFKGLAAKGIHLATLKTNEQIYAETQDELESIPPHLRDF